MIAYGFHFLVRNFSKLIAFGFHLLRAWSCAGVPGLEPRLTEPESAGLPITPYPIKAFARMR
jgi:hypothetical protein